MPNPNPNPNPKNLITQCYLEMLAALEAGDLAKAGENALALQHWLNHGGFPPQDFKPEEVHSALADVIGRSDAGRDLHKELTGRDWRLP